MKYERAVDIYRVADEQDPSERARLRQMIAREPDRPLIRFGERHRYRMCGHYPIGFQLLKAELMIAGRHEQGRRDDGWAILNHVANKIPCAGLWGAGLTNRIPVPKMLVKQAYSRRRLWIADLRSTDEPQTIERLQTPYGFCCLGRLCEVAISDGVDVPKRRGDNGTMWYGNRTSVPPQEVSDWLMNDVGRLSFTEIADEIEKRYL